MRSVRIELYDNTPEVIGTIQAKSLAILEWMASHNKSSAGRLIYDMLSNPSLSDKVLIAYDNNTQFPLGAALLTIP